MTRALALSLAALAWASGAPAGGQSYQVASESPLRLLEAPAEPVPYFEMGQRARALVGLGKAGAAIGLAERLVHAYPRDGENWLLLALARRDKGKHLEAAPAFERAGALLSWREVHFQGSRYYPSIEAAISYLAGGDRASALDALRRDVFKHRSFKRAQLRDLKGLEALRDDPEFLEIAGRPDTSDWTRDEGWRRDIEYLVSEVKRVNPDYHDSELPDELLRRYRALVASVAERTDEELFVEINRLLAALHQGHVHMWQLDDSRIREFKLPVFFYAFPDGLYLIDSAAPEYKPLVGARVVRIGDVPAAEALRRLNETQSVDGDMQYVFNGPGLLRKMPFLVGLGLAPDADSVDLLLQHPGSAPFEVRVNSVPPAQAPGFKLTPPPGVPPPLFLQKVSQAHWEQALPESDAHYVQLNLVAPGPEESLPEFAIRLRSLLGATRPKNLILDVRHNNGGNSQTYPELLRTLIGHTQVPGNRLYVLIGRGTYSAAANLVTDLERLGHPIFVGEATSECCSFYGDANFVVLPFSGLKGPVTAVKWNLSLNPFDERRELNPHVPVQLTARDYFEGRDPVLEAVERLIARGDPDLSAPFASD